MTRKISKACEGCVKAKVRCSGEQPCQYCQTRSSDCVYRQKPRPRRISKRAKLLAVADEGASADATVAVPLAIPMNEHDRSHRLEEREAGRPEVHDSVAATHHAPQSTDSSQLYYGPSSNFAFLQQIHRGILSQGSNSQVRGWELPEWGPGLDMFMQRKIFFGTPLKVNIEPSQLLSCQGCPATLEQATVFLDHFKSSSIYLLPFFTSSELDDLLPCLYRNESVLPPQNKALLLAILALGAMCTPQTELAEALFIQAKREAVVYDDAVTLPMVQFSLLMADYQLNMGRPNSAHLHLGVACRKAFALGLHTGTVFGSAPEYERQKRLLTFCCLYFYETVVGFAVGRKSMIDKSDISSPYPHDQSVMVSLCRLGIVLEEGAGAIYSRRSDSFRQLYTVAEKTHGELRQFAQQFGIGSPTSMQENAAVDTGAAMFLQVTYYFAIMLTFRPFLIAESALQTGGSGQQTGEMWLRQACRQAIDAAQDCINVIYDIFQRDDACKGRRYTSFFIESSCAVLLHDSLRHPSKHPHNMEYIQMAIDCLRSMVQDDPVTNAISSIQRILHAVEHSISQPRGKVPTPSLPNTALPLAGNLHSETQPRQQLHQPLQSSIQFPSLDRNPSASAEELIYFRDQSHHIPTNALAGYQMPLPGTNISSEMSALNSFSNLNFDVLTTDLFNFFPVDMTPLEP